MNTANKLTLCRVVMIPIFIVLLYLEFAGHLWVALAVFILASVTDFVDGYVAGTTTRSPTLVNLWTPWRISSW